MTPFAATKAAVAGFGILLFIYGIRSESITVRWVGIGTLAVAFALRFIDPARRR